MQQQSLTALVAVLKQVRIVETEQPFIGEVRLLYYDGYLQKAKQVNDVKLP